MPSQAPYQIRPISQGQVVTEGARIIAEDGSFELVAGQPFAPPFQQGGDCLLDPTVDNYRQALATGARPVQVQLADGRQLYGLLSLCGAPAGASGPATSSYAIQIPDSYIEATSGGRVSVVFEPFTSSPVRAKAWILWLSERSFRGEAPDPNAGTVDWNVDAAFRPYKKMRTTGLIIMGGGAVFALYGFSQVGTDNIAGGVIGCAIGLSALTIGGIFVGAPGAREAIPRKLSLDETVERDRIVRANADDKLVFGISGRF